MLLSKRHIKTLKIFLISPLLEKILLFKYLLLFAIIVSMASFESTSILDNYTIRSNVIEYFQADNLTSLSSFDDVYDYLNNILVDKLWVNETSPYKPVGTLRFI